MVLIGMFLVALVFSFVGSIPPGTINLSVMQLAMLGKKSGALSFALAASVVEFVYAGLAVRFQIFLTENLEIANWFTWISGSVLIILGIYNLIKRPKRKDKTEPNQATGEKRSGFLRGVLVALANPLAIPYWLAVTAYLQSMGWVTLTDSNFLIYVAGVSTGTFLLLVSVIYLGSRFTAIQNNTFLLYRVPGIIFILMGVWTFVQ
ncbi:LysE family transporter [Reichenbachiella agarivorans]|uniref:LysE family transporter n=1 Tax=Reichenbachiella agarivorans TaxID=2979464 RepID=A0ABY6CR70_9BACT|nr:LysE family transporter [Reichenbachiella agarivorans]UXP32997.1 LysE family transporter [Reichenbachiella agarivorans]